MHPSFSEYMVGQQEASQAIRCFITAEAWTGPRALEGEVQAQTRGLIHSLIEQILTWC